jgi:hypothetical protein
VFDQSRFTDLGFLSDARLAELAGSPAQAPTRASARPTLFFLKLSNIEQRFIPGWPTMGL